MKKLLIALLALAVVGGLAFAQDAAKPAPALQFSGYLNVGGIYTTPDKNANFFDASGLGEDATWAMNGWDSGTGGRFNLGGKYSAEGYGVAFRLREQDTWDAGNAGKLMVRRLYGWTDFAGGMIRLQAGRLGDYAWATGSGGGWNAFGNVDGPVGIQLQVMPVKGLNFGAFVPTTGQASGKATDYFSNTLLGAAYYMDGVGDVEFGYQAVPNTAAVTTAAASEVYIATGDETLEPGVSYTTVAGAPQALPLTAGNVYIKNTAASKSAVVKNLSSFYFGAAYTGMKDLTAYVEGQMVNLGDKDNGYTYLRWYFDYIMGGLDLTLVAMQQMYNLSDLGTTICFSPTVGYTLSEMVKAEVNATYSTNPKWFDKDLKQGGEYGLELSPDVLFTVGSGTVRLGLDYFMGDYVPGTGETNTDAKPADLVRGKSMDVYLDFVWSF